MAVQIPFPLPSTGFALNSKMRINLDFLVDQFNQFNTGTATWDTVAVGVPNSETGTVTFWNSSNAFYLTLQAGATAANTTYTLPAALPGSTPGILTSTTLGVMSWKTSFDSWSIGTASTTSGTLIFYDAANSHTLTLQPGSTSADTTFTLPTAAPASTSILTSTSGGVMSFVTGTGILYNGSLFSGSASVANALAKVSTLGVVTLADHSYSITSASNGFLHITGGVAVTTLANALGTEGILTAGSSGTGHIKSLLGTTSQIVVTYNTSDVTLSLPQSIATSSNVTFNSLQVDGGSATNPGLRVIFSGASTNTGIWSGSGTELNLTVAGATRFSIDSTGLGVATGELRAPTMRATTALKVSTSTGSIVTIQGLSSSFGDYTLTLPPNDGNASDVLQTDGSGVLTWVSVSAAGGATKALDNLASVAINTALLPGTTNSIALGSASKTWSNIFASLGTFSGPVGIADGATGSATAGVYFTSDSDTGMYHEANNSVSFMTAGARAARLNGGGQFLLPDGTAAAPSFTFFTDGGSGMYLPVSDVLGFAAGTVKVAAMNQPSTSDATYRSPLQLYNGGGGSYGKFGSQTTTSVSTSATTILTLDESLCFIMVSGNDATNYFADLILSGNTGSANVIMSSTVQGSPTARTYSVVSASNFKLAMASGTYSINAFSIQVKAR